MISNLIVANDRLVKVISLLLIALALAYLGLKIVQVSSSPGYDFKFVWLAGKMWSLGENPYALNYTEFGERIITHGNVPESWAYPPTWWGPAVGTAAFPLETANVIWNTFTVAMVALSCWFLTLAMLHAFPDFLGGGQTPRLFVFALAFFFLAILESTAIHISAGQTTIACLIGASILLYGLQRESSFYSTIGVLLLLMKPQIGLAYLLPVLMTGAFGVRVVAYAAVLALVLSAPSMLASISAFWEFAVNVAGYDDFTVANFPESMTGIRHLIVMALGLDIGNKAAVAITLIIVFLSVWGPFRIPRSSSVAVLSFQRIATATAVVLALGPLHTYDFILLVIPALLLLRARGVELAVAGAALLIMLRSENLAAMTGIGPQNSDIFQGSTLLTIGALVFAAGLLMAVAKLNESERAYLIDAGS